MPERRPHIEADGESGRSGKIARPKRRPATIETSIGLYYPFWVFWDQNWLKLAALYWDKLARIAPAGMDPIMLGDIDSAKALKDELGFIVNIPFGEEVQRIAPAFLNLIEKHEAKLVESFSLTPAHTKILQGKGSRDTVPFDPTFIWGGGMAADLADRLVGTKLAAWCDRDRAPDFLAMHPKIAVIYKQALAEEMAIERQMTAVTDDMLFHVAATGWSADRLARGILDNKDFADSTPSPGEVVQQMAMIAIQTVVPRDIDKVPIERIIRLRQRHADELSLFQGYVRRLVYDSPALLQITDQDARAAHLQALYEKTLAPQFDQLRRSFRSAGIDIAMGAMNVRLAMAPAVAGMAQSVLGSFESIVAGTGAAILSIVPVIRKVRRATAKRVQASPAAYLMSVQEGLHPSTLVYRMQEKWRQFLGHR